MVLFYCKLQLFYIERTISMKCIGIIWNSAFPYRKEMTEIISKYAISIGRQFEINLDNQYNDFVREIYNGEDIENWKIESKISHMENNPNKEVYIVFFEIDSKAQRYHTKKKKNVYAKLQDLKDLLRNSYKEKVDNYFFDIIFHCTETNSEFDKCNEVIKKYISN